MARVADTWCQITILPLRSANNLGLTKRNFISLMRGTIKEDIDVLRAIVVNVATTDSATGSAKLTRMLLKLAPLQTLLLP